MKKLLFVIIILSLVTATFAQTQRGYVKTKGRMVNGQLVPGQGLKGATVSVQGRNTVVVNNDEGEFSFPVPNEQFKLDSVRKKGYQLVDMDACPRTYNYSGNPIYIVMETPDQQLQDQLTAERKIRRNLQKQLQDKEDEIEGLKAQNKITDDEYRKSLQKLYQDQENNEQLIKDMAKRYSELDYDQLDEFYRQVSYCIENGELTKADSLLNTRGDLSKQVEEQLQKAQAIKEQQEQLDQAKAVHAADQEELAKRCYSFYENFAAQHLNDTAAYYLELRASLDTTNVEWQNDAGDFIQDYIADYENALNYYQRALRQAQIQYGQESEQAVTCYMNIGGIYYAVANYNKAMDYYNKALTINKNVLEERNTKLASSIYSNMANVYYCQENYNMAYEYMIKSQTFLEMINDKDPNKAYILFNIGVYYQDVKNDFEKAMQCYTGALAIITEYYGENHPDVAMIYNALGGLYEIQREYNKALEYQIIALENRILYYGENHPSVAISYGSISTLYFDLKNYSQALEYAQKQLVIHQKVFGDQNLKTAKSYRSIGINYYRLGEYSTAIEYYEKANTIYERFYDDNHSDIAYIYYDLGSVCYEMGDYEKALEYHEKALSIFKQAYGDNNIKTSYSYFFIGSIYNKTGDCEKALEYFKKGMDINEKIYDKDNIGVVDGYYDIGKALRCLGKYTEAIEYHIKALNGRLEIYGEVNPDVASSYYQLGSIYLDMCDYEKAVYYFEKAVAIDEAILGPEHQYTLEDKEMLESAKQKLSESEK